MLYCFYMPNIIESALSPFVQEFIDKYQEYVALKPLSETVVKIHVDEIASKIAGFYSYLRNIVDYQEEHLLRKGIIERTLKRYLALSQKHNSIAEPFLKEIIRSGHLPKDTVPEGRIKDLQKIIDKYRFFISRLSARREKDKKNIYEWLIDLCACELEEKIDPPVKDNLLASLMYQVIKDRITIQGAQINEEQKNIQIFINVQRSLLRVDESQLNYRLLKFVSPNWVELNQENILPVAETISSLYRRIQQYRKGSIGPVIAEVCNQYNTIFYLIGDIVFQKDKMDDSNKPTMPAPIPSLANPEQTEKLIKAAYRKRYEKEKSKLAKLAFFSVVSFFLSKILIALFIEIPLDKYLVHHFVASNIIMSILFPPILMLIIISAIKMPSEKNIKLVTEESRSVIFADRSKKYLVRISESRSWAGEVAMYLFYLITFVISFGLLSWLLVKLNFSVAGIIVFLFFTSLVAVTGVKIYNRSRELSLERERASFLYFLIDLFAMPLVTVGRWVASGLSRFNVLALIFDLAIETPLQALVVFLENFRGFIKTKKEEIY